MDKTLVGTEESAGAVIQRYSVNKVFRKIVQSLQKIPVLESVFNEASGLETCNSGKVTAAKLLLCGFCKVLRNTYFVEHLYLTVASESVWY